MTRVITLACQKGGVGKSTTAANLLVALAETGSKVAGISLDTQGSLILWAKVREQSGKPAYPVLPVTPAKVPTAIRDAGAAGLDYLVIDTPPTRSNADIEAAVTGADLVVIPVAAELFDIAAAKPTVQLCRQHSKRFVIVISRAPAPLGFGEPKVLRDARTTLGGLGTVLPVPIVTRRAHSVAMASGAGVVELDDEKAAREVRALRDWIKGEL